MNRVIEVMYWRVY